ncbi:NDR1/HIN1-like protein 6 [Oryza brachyantha]|uniref:NDR1/HIN1-like protein 6 n=1 Tax=Oryza brachyantha TaxID=4533 RepID=UPI001ADD184B|nr:NDR1/HIN1-like protein 6 [Oryza brachyantha]
MANYHRIHPVGVGSPSPAPEYQQQQGGKGRKPSYGEKELPITAPQPYAPAPLSPPGRRSRSHGRRCCRCVCWTLLAVLVLAVALGATAGILYAVFKPKIPDFRVDRLTVTRFDVNATSMTVSDAFEVEVTSTNPNRRIGIYYDGGEVTASFNGTELCRGGFPALYQGHRSTVRPLIRLAGETRLDSAVATQLARQQQDGFVPLTVWARVPIRIKFGAVKLWKMTGKATCSLVVDNLQVGRQLRIRSNNCSFKLKV